MHYHIIRMKLPYDIIHYDQHNKLFTTPPIGFYVSEIARWTTKFNGKYILYTNLHWDFTNN
jgi:hypothetical protein